MSESAMTTPRPGLLLALLLLGASACGGGGGGTQCGDAAQACCAGDACHGDLVCSGGTCQNPPPCGALTQACCASDVCDGDLVCSGGTCQTPPPPCGALTQACCASNVCDGGLACRDGTCQTPCGTVGLACCGGTSCDGDLVCDGGSCRPPCGALTQECCAGNVCDGDLACDGWVCQGAPASCGALAEACCTGGACEGGLLCESGTCAADVCTLDTPGLNWIAYTTARGGGLDLALVRDDGQCQDPTLVDGPGPALFPAWSPDGKLGYTGVDGLYLRDLTSGQDTGLLTAGIWPSAPAFSPDGASILFEGVATAGGRSDVYLRLLVGGLSQPLTAAPGNSAGPVWAPGGATIYFVSDRGDGVFRVYTMDANGDAETVLSGTAGVVGRPAVSPDGLHLAYARLDADGRAKVVVRTLASGAEQVITAAGAVDEFDPAFDPSGTRLALVSTRDGDLALWAVDAHGGGHPVRVTTPAADEVDGQPAFRLR